MAGKPLYEYNVQCGSGVLGPVTFAHGIWDWSIADLSMIAVISILDDGGGPLARSSRSLCAVRQGILLINAEKKKPYFKNGVSTNWIWPMECFDKYRTTVSKPRRIAPSTITLRVLLSLALTDHEGLPYMANDEGKAKLLAKSQLSYLRAEC